MRYDDPFKNELSQLRCEFENYKDAYRRQAAELKLLRAGPNQESARQMNALNATAGDQARHIYLMRQRVDMLTSERDAARHEADDLRIKLMQITRESVENSPPTQIYVERITRLRDEVQTLKMERDLANTALSDQSKQIEDLQELRSNLRWAYEQLANRTEKITEIEGDLYEKWKLTNAVCGASTVRSNGVVNQYIFGIPRSEYKTEKKIPTPVHQHLPPDVSDDIQLAREIVAKMVRASPVQGQARFEELIVTSASLLRMIERLDRSTIDALMMEHHCKAELRPLRDPRSI
jgi:phage-related tail protein